MGFITLAVILLGILLWRNNKKSTVLHDRINRLEIVVESLKNQLNYPGISELDNQEAENNQDTEVGSELNTPNEITAELGMSDSTNPNSEQSAPSYKPDHSSKTPEKQNQLIDHIKANWMLWLGGFCVAISGIFIAKYSIEQGLLSPSARITLGFITGIALIVCAEYLRRSKGSHPSFAALAGGGSITLYAITLSAFHFYSMFSPVTTFVLLAMIALGTMALSYWQGPALAAIGLLGAYTVPIFISDGRGAIHIAVIYALIITASGLYLLKFVYRKWLWVGILFGALSWWLISLGFADREILRGCYLAILAYFLLSIRESDWFLRTSYTLTNPTARSFFYSLPDSQVEGSRNLHEKQLRLGLLLIIAAYGISHLLYLDYSELIFAYTPLLFILLVAARTRQSLTVLPWVVLVTILIAILLNSLDPQQNNLLFGKLGHQHSLQLFKYSAVVMLISVVLGFVNFKQTPFKNSWASFITVGPLLLLTLSYYLTENILTQWQWITLYGALTCLFLFVAGLLESKAVSKDMTVWLVFAGHLAASIAAVMLTQDGHLTLAIALQLVSVAWIIKHFEVPELGWILKLIAMIVVARLTLNPWLVQYDMSTHWTLSTYGGSTLCAVIAAYFLKPYPSIKKWAEGAALHLLVLFLWAELRYWCNDGDIFAQKSSLIEITLSMILFTSVSIVYYIRSYASENLTTLYRIFSYLLLLLGVMSYLMILLLTLTQHSFVWSNIDQTPIWNQLLLCFGMPIILSLGVWKYHDKDLSTGALAGAAITAFIFINLQIKHLWNGSIRLYDGMQNGELYTYSIVWLLMSVGCILGGALKSNQAIYKAGLVLLGLVVAKLFIVDLSGLDGLLRIASFMGLGLSLLALYYLHQRIQNSLNKI